MSWDFELVAGPYGGVTEGPIWDGSGLLFTHIPSSKILKYDEVRDSVSEFLTDTYNANGLMLDSNGVLHACQGGARRVVRYEIDGSVTVLASGFEGSRLNIPNDLAIHRDGSIWFTDPYYEGAAGPWSEDRANKDLDHDSVYRIDSQKGRGALTRLTFDTTRPNGILFSLDYSVLYVAQSGRLPDEKRELRAYPVLRDMRLGAYEVLHDFGEHRGIDGMVLDTNGNIIATAGFEQSGPGPMIYVFSSEGAVMETHPMPVDRPTNCSFGGTNLSTLYVTTINGHLFRTDTNRQGRLLYPALSQDHK